MTCAIRDMYYALHVLCVTRTLRDVYCAVAQETCPGRSCPGGVGEGRPAVHRRGTGLLHKSSIRTGQDPDFSSNTFPTKSEAPPWYDVDLEVMFFLVCFCFC